MLDIATLIEATITATNSTTHLPTYWEETDPAMTDITWTMDEFDPRSPALQVLFENFPEKKEWVHDAVYKVIHRCRITIFLKPIRYAEADIEANKTTFFNARTEIDRILSVNKFNITGIANLELETNGWNDKNSIRVGRGTKDMGTFLQSIGGKDTAIIFRSEQIVTAVYYLTTTLFLGQVVTPPFTTIITNFEDGYMGNTEQECSADSLAMDEPNSMSEDSPKIAYPLLQDEGPSRTENLVITN